MDNVRNKLPVAVRDSVGRTGGQVVSLQGASYGSFSTGTAARFRLFANLFSSYEAVVLLSYEGDAHVSEAECRLADGESIYEQANEALTVHWRLVNRSDCSDAVGGASDFIGVTFYE